MDPLGPGLICCVCLSIARVINLVIESESLRVPFSKGPNGESGKVFHSILFALVSFLYGDKKV